MTRQQIFNKVAKHLLTQKKKAKCKTEFGLPMCAYKTEDGLRCAVGCLIPKKYYSKDFEGIAASEVVLLLKKKGYNKFIGHESLLSTLQYIHDNTKPSRWKSQLSTLAKKCNLNTDVLKSF